MAVKPTPFPQSPPLSPSQSQAVDRIATLGDLPENWDGYGSPSVSIPAREAACHMVMLLRSGADLIVHIAPTPGGGVQVDLESAAGSLEIHIAPGGTGEFLLQAGAENIEGALADPTRQIPELLAHLAI